MSQPESITIIAGSGKYPLLLAVEARRAGVGRVFAAAFEGETSPEIAELTDGVKWMRVGQLGRLLEALKDFGAPAAMMAGQIAPSNLFNLRPDVRALVLLAKLPVRNAETLFGTIADEIGRVGVELLPAMTFLEAYLAAPGHIAGPPLRRREIDDAQFGFRIAKETSRLDIGQTVVVRNGTVLAVEAFEGTNEAIRRGGALGNGRATVVKVSKRNQDFRFDVPVIGPVTLETAAAVGVRTIVVEAGRTLLLERENLIEAANARKITIFGAEDSSC